MFSRRWPRRREFLAYYMLYRFMGDRVFDLGEAVDLLAPMLGGKRLAARMVKRLVRQGFLERVEPLRYRARSIDELLLDALLHYMASRLRRRGYRVEVRGDHICVYEGPEPLPSHPLVKRCQSSSSS